jgi:hypothetical protein
MAKLTDGRAGTIAKAELPEKGQRFIFDDHRDAPRGFGLRVTKAGGKAFILKYSIDGRERRKTLGDWPTWSLEAARAEAQDLTRAINKGTDPLEAKRRRKGCDWIVANAVGGDTGTFGGTENTVHLLAAGGTESWPRMSKADVADRLANRIADVLGTADASGSEARKSQVTP